MKYFYLAAAVILLSGFYFVREPMEANFKDSAMYRWLNKKVHDKRMLDAMENLYNIRCANCRRKKSDDHSRFKQFRCYH